MIRGMLPFDKSTGRLAYKRLAVHMGVPDELANQLNSAVPIVKKVPKMYISMSDLSRELGWYGKA